MELKKRKYKRAEVLAMIDAYRKEYETRLNEQKANIQELIKEKNLALNELHMIKERENLILLTLERAEKTACEIKEQAENEYALEIERLRAFSNKWESYFKKIKEKYPTSSAVKKAVSVKDKIDSNLKKGVKPKKIIEEVDVAIGNNEKKKFNPKEKIRDYIAATSDNGFNLDEVLNPGDLQLEDLCKELGLIEEND